MLTAKLKASKVENHTDADHCLESLAQGTLPARLTSRDHRGEWRNQLKPSKLKLKQSKFKF